MSFSGKVKEELCKIPIQKSCCAYAEAHGVLLYCNAFLSGGIRIITESRPFAKRLPKLFRKAFAVDFDRVPQEEETGKLVFEILSEEKLDLILSALGFSSKTNLALHINFGLLEEECCQASFLRGAFLAGGSVTDPLKRYHLELVTSHFNVCRELAALLNDIGFPSKDTVRSGNYVTYFKQSEHIEDLLTMIGAPVAAMDIMSAKVEKNLRNEMNRRVNCDTANVEKTVDAAQEQILAIRRLKNEGIMDKLPEKLRLTASLRMENPEMSLAQLSECFDPPISKSCLNHRIRKLLEISKEKG